MRTCKTCRHLNHEQRYCDAVAPGRRVWLYRDGRPIEFQDCIAYHSVQDLLFQLREWRDENKTHLEDNGSLWELNRILDGEVGQ
jgi:hypothetical protein